MDKVQEFIISDNPSPKEMIEQIAYVTNTIALLAERLARLKNIMAEADDTYKQICDEKLLMYAELHPKANQMKLKALVNVDDDVIRAKLVLQEAKAKTVLADNEYKSWDNRFIALRKIASIKSIEMQSLEK